MEIRSPCNSSSQTFSTVPAFPSVSTTALPINSDCAAPYSSKIFDARRFPDGIARPWAVCAVLGGSTAKFVPANDRWRLLFQFAEPVDLRSKALREVRLFLQERA